MEVVHTQTRRETVLIAGGGRTLKGEIEREVDKRPRGTGTSGSPCKVGFLCPLETQEEAPETCLNHPLPLGVLPVGHEEEGSL